MTEATPSKKLLKNINSANQSINGWLRILFLGMLLTTFFPGQVFSDTPENSAICIRSQLRVRSIPDPRGRIVTHLEKGEEVFVVRTTAFKQSINDLTTNWYQIVRYNGVSGWVFGGYLDTGKIRDNHLFYTTIDHPGEAIDPAVTIMVRNISHESIPGSISWISIGRSDKNEIKRSTQHEVSGKELLFLKLQEQPALLALVEISFSGYEFRSIFYKATDRNSDSYADIEVQISEGNTDGGAAKAYVLTWRPELSRFILDSSLNADLGNWKAH